MPTYEYRCDSCEKNFDVVQSFHDDALTTCPTCGSRVRKVFGNVGIVFKGSGFYKTDSRPGAAKAPAKDAAASESSGSEGSGGSGGEGAAPAPASSGDGASTTSTSTSPSTSTSDSTKSPTTPSAPKTPAKTPSKESGS